jgi:proteasome assembly chaperone (PAC2) family protein
MEVQGAGRARRRTHQPATGHIMNDSLQFLGLPEASGGSTRMVIGFSGWMDGGEASTGSIEHMVDLLDAYPLADIDSDEFYIFGFPGSMEVSTLFRPHGAIEDGLLTEFSEPANRFWYTEEHRLVLFEGKEPHLHWARYRDCILDVADSLNVDRIFFVGSVAGSVPHSRECRLYGSVSDALHRPLVDEYGLRPSNYEGPVSFTTFLMAACQERDLMMANIVAEVPAYVQGRNPKSIEAIVSKLDHVLGIPLDVASLRLQRRAFEEHVDAVVNKRDDLVELVRQMEEDYDREARDEKMEDVKDWFDKQDIPLE